MFGYPLLYRAGLLDALSPQAVGVYTGSTIHEVAHVVGAGAAMTPDIQSSSVDIAGIATMTKMLRVLMLAPVLMILGYIMRRGSGGNATSGEDTSTLVCLLLPHRHRDQYATGYGC